MANPLAIRFLEKGNVLLEFPILYAGWELDYEAWVIEYQGETRLIATNHGGPYFINESEIEEKIAEYQKAIETSRRALEIMRLASSPPTPGRHAS